MESLGRAASFWAALTILIYPISLMADTVIISATAPPALSTGIGGSSLVSTSWSQSGAYADVTITALVNSLIVGESPSATAYLTTEIGPGTTATDEIAHSAFTVPTQLPVCSPSSCGAFVTLFSGLTLGPGDYFLTMGPPTGGLSAVGWFPAINPTVVEDIGVTQGPCVFASGTEVAPYPPASAFGSALGVCGRDDVMNFTVTGAAATSAPEPVAAILIASGALFLLIIRRPVSTTRQYRRISL
jgi:hypothetical protein